MTNLIPPLSDGYFAVPDPDDPSTTTCWRVKDDSGKVLTSSPSGAQGDMTEEAS